MWIEEGELDVEQKRQELFDGISFRFFHIFTRFQKSLLYSSIIAKAPIIRPKLVHDIFVTLSFTFWLACLNAPIARLLVVAPYLLIIAPTFSFFSSPSLLACSSETSTTSAGRCAVAAPTAASYVAGGAAAAFSPEERDYGLRAEEVKAQPCGR